MTIDRLRRWVPRIRFSRATYAVVVEIVQQQVLVEITGSLFEVRPVQSVNSVAPGQPCIFNFELISVQEVFDEVQVVPEGFCFLLVKASRQDSISVLDTN